MPIVNEHTAVLAARQDGTPPVILIVEDVHETRDGIEKLLMADGYRIALARDERDAIESAQRTRPDLILVSLGGLARDVILSARNIRNNSNAGEGVPIVVFCIEGIGEGDEITIGQNVHLTRPDNFNQLRNLIARLVKVSVLIKTVEVTS